MTRKRDHRPKPACTPPITLITGPRESGRTTYATMTCLGLYAQGVVCLHNGTLLFGRNIEEYADSHDGLQTLAERIPGSCTLLIEEADAQRATRQTDDPKHETAINSALAKLAEKSCYLILSTVQGNERLIARPLVERAYEHVTPFMEAESLETVALATMHRFGQYLVPTTHGRHDPESVIEAMKLANTFKEMRRGAPKGKDVVSTEDRLFEVPQTSIYEMTHPKHPEYPVYYRHRIVRRIPNGGIHRLTQDSIFHFTWLESVNEHPNETIALEMLERTMPRWGFEYRSLPTAQDTNFPDGRAFINGEPANLEIVSIQPRYSGGHNLHHLVALTEVGRAEQPVDATILRCKTCRTTEPVDDVTWENLPDHDESHLWVMYLPGRLYAPDWPYDFAATPLLTIRQEDFAIELEEAVRKKSKIIAAQGKGLRNWVVVLAQGFPVDADWYDRLPVRWPDDVDGICVVATEGYVGAYRDKVPFNDFTALLLKCPPDFQDHNCYHPGYSYRVGGMNTDFEPLSMDRYTIGEVSSAAWNYPLPAGPIRKTLTVRDRDGREIQTFWGANITEFQAREILDAAGYEWREQSPGSLQLCSEDSGSDLYGCGAEVQCIKNEVWIGDVLHEGHRLRGEFTTKEEAKGWCEIQTAMLLLHIEG